jgi:tetratricopeptide (TPR) repeat protein
MNTKLILGLAVGAIVGFTAGFLIANSLNKSAIEAAKTEAAVADPGNGATAQGASKVELSNEEIKAKIAEADKNAGNFEYQKTLGLALYTYAAMKQEAGLLEDVLKLLDRAYKLNGDDYDVIVSLANVNFDLGQLKKDESYNARARELYQKALTKNEKDARVRTDLGLTYLQGARPENDKAIEELMKALGLDPSNEKALQYLSQAYAAKGDTDDARRVLEALRKINPQSPAIPDLEARIAPAK